MPDSVSATDKAGEVAMLYLYANESNNVKFSDVLCIYQAQNIQTTWKI